MLSAFGGHPSQLIVLTPVASPTLLVSVGLGAAAWTPPELAQFPTQMTAAAFLHTLLAISRNVLPWIFPYTPLSLVGIPPSAMAIYCPFWFFTTPSRISSA